MPRFGQTPKSEHNVPQGVVNGFLIELPVPEAPDTYPLTLTIPIKGVDQYTNYEIGDAGGNPTDHVTITGLVHKEAGIELSILITPNFVDGDDYGLIVYRRANEKVFLPIFQAVGTTDPLDPFYSTGIPVIDTTVFISSIDASGKLPLVVVITDLTIPRAPSTHYSVTSAITTLTLWASPQVGDHLSINNSSGAAFHINGNGVDVINAPTFNLANTEAVRLVFNGTKWEII